VLPPSCTGYVNRVSRLCREIDENERAFRNALAQADNSGRRIIGARRFQMPNQRLGNSSRTTIKCAKRYVSGT